MGFITSATSLTLTAKLTPLGRERILSNSIGIVSKFSLGDSDANYNVQYPLLAGYIPATGGDIGPDSATTNSTYGNLTLRSKLYYIPNSEYKLVEPNSSILSTSNEYLGFTTLSASNLTHELLDRTDTADRLGNLFFTCGLPITTNDKLYFTTFTYANGGFADTAISGINQDNVLVIAIGNSTYGELIDGKTVKVSVTTTAATFDLYGTYRSGIYKSQELDGMYREPNTDTSVIGNNIVFLFSDSIKKPNGDATKSWATGWNAYKSFALGNKEQFNYTTLTSVGKTADTACGILYLDKGLIAITDSTIVNDFDLVTCSSATTVQFNSIVTRVTQDITCISDRGEFATSSNRTWTSDNTPRISEVGLYDSSNNLLAVAKLDRHVEIPGNSFLALTVRISV